MTRIEHARLSLLPGLGLPLRLGLPLGLGLLLGLALPPIAVPAFGADPPARILDLSRWLLTIPEDTDRDGSPDEVVQPELNTYTDARYFFATGRPDGVVFRAQCGGATTKGSSYPRCELRELRSDGTDAAWDTDDHVTHTLTMRAAITQTPPVKRHVVCAQIHHAKDDLMMIRLEGTKLFIERNSVERVMLNRDYQLGDPFDIKIQAGGGSVMNWYNGELKMNWEVTGSGCYFKAGCYTQSNPSKGDAADAYGEVVIYELETTHRKPT